jgi:hypothetical protein
MLRTTLLFVLLAIPTLHLLAVLVGFVHQHRYTPLYTLRYAWRMVRALASTTRWTITRQHYAAKRMVEFPLGIEYRLRGWRRRRALARAQVSAPKITPNDVIGRFEPVGQVSHNHWAWERTRQAP